MLNHTYLDDILLKTALKKFKLNANKTLHARFFNCSTVGFSLGTSAKKKNAYITAKVLGYNPNLK
jgi:hypothetical protein